MTRRSRWFQRMGLTAAAVVFLAPASPAAAHRGNHCFFVDTEAAQEVGAETEPVRLCAGHDPGGGTGIPTGGGGSVGDAGGAPTRIDAGGGATSAAVGTTAAPLLALGAAITGSLLRRRRRS